MKIKIVNVFLALVLSIGLVLPFALPVQASTEVEAITGEGSQTGGVYVGGTTNWANINSNDDATSYLTASTAGAANVDHTYVMSSFTSSTASISGVTLTARVFAASGYARGKFICRISGTNYYSSIFNTSGLWITYDTDTFGGVTNKNPATGLDWTAADINAAEWGVYLSSDYYPQVCACSYLALTTTYTASSTPTVTTQALTSVAPDAATGNGNISSNGGLAITEKGICYVAGTSGDPTTANSTSHDHVNTTGAYTESITGLSKGTAYRARAYAINSTGTGYGDTVDLTTIGDPTITTLDASVMASTSARLNAQVSFDGNVAGGENCTVTFAYQAGTGFANYAAVSSGGTETAATGVYTINQLPYIDIIGLTISTTYSFAAKISNSTSTDAYGAVMTFATSSGVDPPANLTAIPYATTISVAWVKGTGAANSMVRYTASSYPATTATGVLAYSGTSGSCVIAGLIPGTTYYISVWGYTGAVFSSTYATVLITTVVTTENVTVLPPSEYATPYQWFQAPDYTRMAKFPLYDIINWGADQFQVPRATDWFTLAFIFCILIGVLIYRLSTNIPASAGSIAATIVFCSYMGLMELWLVVPFILIGAGAWIQGNRA